MLAVGDTLDREAVCDLVVRFLEVCVHQILFARGIYPSQLFEVARIYDTPVRMSRCTPLNQYIHDAKEGVRKELLKGGLTKVAVCIGDGNGTVLERYVLQVDLFIAKPLSITPEELHKRFADCIMKIALIGPGRLPEETTWSIVALSKSASIDDRWELAEQEQAAVGCEEARADGFDVTMLKSIRSGPLEVQFYLEDHRRRKAQAQ